MSASSDCCRSFVYTRRRKRIPRGLEGGGFGQGKVGEEKEIKMADWKSRPMEKGKIVAIVFSIFLIGCLVSNRSKLRTDPDGFRDIKWGTEISTLRDMERMEQDPSSNKNVVWYTRRGDLLAIGKAKLETILYAFWLGNFESVWIEVRGDENFDTLKKELFDRFGKVLESEELIKKMDEEPGRGPSSIRHAEEFYAWWGQNTEMTLAYSRERHQGTLNINSKRVGDERRAYEKRKGN